MYGRTINHYNRNNMKIKGISAPCCKQLTTRIYIIKILKYPNMLKFKRFKEISTFIFIDYERNVMFFFFFFQ